MALYKSSTSEVFGQFVHDLPEENLCLKIDFPAQLVQQRLFWPNSYLSAKYVADYASIFLPADSAHAEVIDALRYIANELLENAFKFSCPTTQQPVQLRLYNCPNYLLITVFNLTRLENIGPFRALIRDLTMHDPMALYIERLEGNLDQGHSLESGLGFITILMNYQAELGWKIEPGSPMFPWFGVSTMAQLPKG